MILSAKYYKNADGEQVAIEVKKENDLKTYYVPLAEGNTDYQNILKWEAEGNTIEEAD
tara:strand:+ start:1355 stop:1528 length:174 start_codon:yes stop_codon:yes gene_type:complete